MREFLIESNGERYHCKAPNVGALQRQLWEEIQRFSRTHWGVLKTTVDRTARRLWLHDLPGFYSVITLKDKKTHHFIHIYTCMKQENVPWDNQTKEMMNVEVDE